MIILLKLMFRIMQHLMINIIWLCTLCVDQHGPVLSSHSPVAVWLPLGRSTGRDDLCRLRVGVCMGMGMGSYTAYLSRINRFSLGPIEGGCTGGVGTQGMSRKGIWKVPGCPLGVLEF